MYIFKNEQGKLVELISQPFKLEKHMQNLIEKNLFEIFSYQFISSEFSIKNSRIDTLAFDQENNSFVIIEYKRSQNGSVIDQGISYLNLMLENKSEFIVEYNETQNNNLKRSDVDWTQSKVIFISSSFTEFQIQASNFKDLPIELWIVNQFENGIICINPIKKTKSAPSIKTLEKESLESIAPLRELKVYSEEGHLEDKSEEIKELYITFREAILNLSPEINIEPKKRYIAFKTKGNIVSMCIQKKELKFWINKKQLDDPKKLTRDVSTIGHWGTGDNELIVKDTQNLEYIMSLIKQAL